MLFPLARRPSTQDDDATPTPRELRTRHQSCCCPMLLNTTVLLSCQQHPGNANCKLQVRIRIQIRIRWRDDAVQKLQNHAICGHFECNQQNCLIYDHLQFALIFQITKGRGCGWGLGQRPTKPDSTQKLIIAEAGREPKDRYYRYRDKEEADLKDGAQGIITINN